MLRWYIIRTLLKKEAWRHLADRGGIFVAFLLIGCFALACMFGRRFIGDQILVGTVGVCYVDEVDLGQHTPAWLSHLRSHPPEADLRIRFRRHSQLPIGLLFYGENTGAVQIRDGGTDHNGQPRYVIMVWFPGSDAGVMEPYLRWFWKETFAFFGQQRRPLQIDTEGPLLFPSGSMLVRVSPQSGGKRHFLTYSRLENDQKWFSDLPPPLEIRVEYHQLQNRADMLSFAATALITFAMWFFSVFLMPALTCEERERGVLLAQALSPASTLEIFAAKFLFYPLAGILLGVILAAIYKISVIVSLFFWIALVTTAIGYLGLGLAIASLAPNQRKASMGAMCYLLAIALLLFISLQFRVPLAQHFVLERHCVRLLHASLVGTASAYRYEMIAAIVLSLFWTGLAVRLFRRHGWQ
ncbi:MAG: hypothetical protein KatS3mg105_2553 [Gemmatales bacterium]|nr:MAG: hypothetical protein KatS3mg105_2553 [Gemmatales bacterium]